MSAASPDIAAAVRRLREGGLVAFPTETVYGLGADAFDADAVARVFALKARPANNPLIVHVADAAMVRTVAADWSREADALARAHWPGPLTLVLPKAADVPANVTGGGDTVALRCPAHPVALALIRAFGKPIVGPSANPSGRISPTTAEHVRTGFGDAIARGEVLLLDGGPCRTGIESTVLSLAHDPPRVLRLGALATDDLAALVPGITLARSDNPVAGVMPAPGMLDRHYAPRAPARLFESHDWPETLDGVPGPAVVLTHRRTTVVDPPHTLLRMPMDSEGYASRLYAAMHEADLLQPAIILIESPRLPGPLWDAIRDRLRRACG